MNFLKKTFKAFSILEIAISLTIIGVLTMGVVKGQHLLYAAKIEKTIAQIEAIKISSNTFQNTYHALPGDYNGNALDAPMGNGSGEIDNALFWKHINAADLMNTKQQTPSVGGQFAIVNINNTNYIKLSNNEKGMFTSTQAMQLKIKIDGETNLETGTMRIGKNGGFITQLTQTPNKEYIIFVEL